MYVIAIYLMLSCFVCLERLEKIKVNRTIKVAVFVLVALFFMFRFNLGPDLETYIYIFKRVSSPIKDSFVYHLQRNVGFNIWVFYIKRIFGNYQALMLLNNLVVIAVFSYIVLKYSKNIWVSLLIFIGSGVLEIYYSSAIRQMLAMTIFFYAFYEKFQFKKYGQYLLLCFVALLFHESVLPTLFLPLLLKTNETFQVNRKKYFLIAAIFTFVGFIFNVFVLPGLASFVGISSPIQHVNSYFVSKQTSISLLGFAMEIVIGVGCYWLYMLQEQKDDEFLVLQLQVILVSIFIYIAFAKYPIVSRVCDLIQMLLIIFIPNVLAGIQNKKKATICLTFVLIFNLFLLVADLRFKTSTMTAKKNGYDSILHYPYHTVFDMEYTNRIIDQVDE